MEREYTLYDVFDERRERPVRREFTNKLEPGSQFTIDDVTYRVVTLEPQVAVVRMLKYKIPNTATQFVHKCPAKKGAFEKLSKDDVMKLDDLKKRNLKTHDRVKMQGHMKQKCPHCRTIFWKESMAMPDPVQVPKVYKTKKKSSKRRKS